MIDDTWTDVPKADSRARVTAFIDRHHVAWEFGMAALAVVYLAFALGLDNGYGVPEVALGVLGAVFLAEFSVRLWAAPSRKVYFRQHWIDLVSSLPLVGGLRSVRLLRLLRIGAVVRILTIEKHEAERHHVANGSLWLLGPILLVVWLASSAAYWSFEHGINHSVHNFGDALYWSAITATTVGYGDISPVTAEGRVISGFLILVGVGLVGILSARLTQTLIDSSPDNPIEKRVERIEELVTELHGMVVDMHSRDSVSLSK
jgi:voltage-gated potassium channel